MIKLNKSIENLIQKSNNKMFVFGFLDYHWKQIVGKEISKKTELVKIENKTLFIKCSSPVWKTELQYQKQEWGNLRVAQERRHFQHWVQ